jgi:hypothetical protein
MGKGKWLRCLVALFLCLFISFSFLSCVTTYDVDISVTPEGGGTVTPASGTFNEGTTMQLTAEPEPGYRFDHWSGGATGASNPLSITVDGAKNITAHFIAQCTITTSVSPEGTGTITPVGDTVDIGSVLKYTAQPATGYRFDYWSGDVTGNDNPLIINVDKSKVITAHFKKQYVLTVENEPGDGGTVTPAGGKYDDGANVQLSAEPAPGYRFGSWSGDVTSTSSKVTVSMNMNKTVTANFIAQYVLLTAVNPENGGTVIPAGGTYDEGTELTLTAYANEGFAFDHWSGDVTGTSKSITITMDSDKNITANFVRALIFGVTRDGHDIWVSFPDTLQGNYVDFSSVFAVPSYVSGFSSEITTYDPATHEITSHLKYVFYAIQRSGGKVVYFEWYVVIYSATSDETWHHAGYFSSITYDSHGKIVSFYAYIDGNRYLYSE